MNQAVNETAGCAKYWTDTLLPVLVVAMYLPHVRKILKIKRRWPAADYNITKDRNLSIVKDRDFMPKPTDEELEKAIKTAITMRENSDDPDMLAKCLLSHNYRIKHLEEVLTSADRYFNMGMAERERTHLIRAIEKAKNAESYTSQTEQERFGLE